jgi:hypothetical protein
MKVAMENDCITRLREDWRVARAAHLDLQLLRMPRVNVLLVGPDGVVENVLDMVRPDLRKPIDVWHRGSPLVLPTPSRAATFVLREIAGLAPDDQLRLVQWLDTVPTRAQIISTASAPLLPRVQCGRFLEALYYRLNTVCVDLTA